MSKKRTIAIAAALLATVGAVAAISAPGRRGGHHGEDQMGLGMDGDHDGRRGWFRRGPLTGEEMDARIRERFARIDKNSDGVIDTAEAETATVERARLWRERFAGRDREGREPGADMLRRFDENKDGKATKDEFLNHVKRGFAEMDLNNDGRITDDDLPPMMRGRGAIAKMAAGEHGPERGRFGRGSPGGAGPKLGWLRGVEVKDGAMTLDAVIANATKEFERLDRNKDGAVDKADFDVMRKEMADYRVKRFMHMFGGDKDGKITREQFAKVAKERMASMELDREAMGHRRGWGGHGRPGASGPDGDAPRRERGPGEPAPKQ
jgi:Ca2+-binding EF-hand superfamily protein